MNRTIDAHAYIGNWPYWPLRHRSVEDVLGLMDAAGIQQAAVSSLRGMFYDWAEGNGEILQLAAQHPGRIIPVVTVAPLPDLVPATRFPGGTGGGSQGQAVQQEGRDPVAAGGPVASRDPVAALERYAEQGARILGLYPVWHGYRIREGIAAIDRVLDAAQALGYIIKVCIRPMMNWGLVAETPQAVEYVARRCPNVPVIAAGANVGDLVHLRGAAERHSNLYLETSALVFRGALEEFVSAVGPGRLLLGTALPLQHPEPVFAQLRATDWPQEVLDSVFGGNLSALLDGGR